jgi:hypothetical protein
MGQTLEGYSERGREKDKSAYKGGGGACRGNIRLC